MTQKKKNTKENKIKDKPMYKNQKQNSPYNKNTSFPSKLHKKCTNKIQKYIHTYPTNGLYGIREKTDIHTHRHIKRNKKLDYIFSKLYRITICCTNFLLFCTNYRLNTYPFKLYYK